MSDKTDSVSKPAPYMSAISDAKVQNGHNSGVASALSDIKGEVADTKIKIKMKTKSETLRTSKVVDEGTCAENRRPRGVSHPSNSKPNDSTRAVSPQGRNEGNPETPFYDLDKRSKRVYKVSDIMEDIVARIRIIDK